MASDAADDCSEEGWRAVLDDWRVAPELLDAAYAEPRVRILFPWTCMGELHFSRHAERRWALDIPYIASAADGAYWVLGPVRSEWVGRGETAAEALAPGVHMPP